MDRGLRVLGRVLVVLLTGIIAAMLFQLGLRLFGATRLPFRLLGNYSLTELDKVIDNAMAGGGLLFVAWFYDARVHAEDRGWRQRRARAWTFWAWLVPIANLFVPFQLMGDLWRAGLPEGRRTRTAWLPAVWWTCWLLAFVVDQPPRRGVAKLLPSVAPQTWNVRLIVLTIAGLALITIIRKVSTGPLAYPPPGEVQ
jgi:Domain of unknown function (DUF4328)